MGTGIVFLPSTPTPLSQTCPQSGWNGFRNVDIQGLLPARSRGMKSKMCKYMKPPAFIPLEKRGASSKRGECSMEEAGGWDGGQSRRRLGRDFKAPVLVRR